jgi:hypothetical protein
MQILMWRAGRRGLVAVIEDLHWADAETIAVCEYLVDHIAETPLVVVATTRGRDGPASVADLVARGERLAVAPLTADQVVAMATACLGTPPAADMRHRLATYASGLPLLVEDLLDPGPGRSTRFDRLVGQRLAALSAFEQRCVVAAAVLGDEEFDGHRIAPVADIGPEDATRALVAAAAAQVLTATVDGRFGFRHALTRDAVLVVALADRAPIAARAAATVERAGLAPPTKPAACLTLAGPSGVSYSWRGGRGSMGRTGAVCPDVGRSGIESHHLRGEHQMGGHVDGGNHYRYDGTLDLASGAGQGIIDETFTGRDRIGGSMT